MNSSSLQFARIQCSANQNSFSSHFNDSARTTISSLPPWLALWLAWSHTRRTRPPGSLGGLASQTVSNGNKNCFSIRCTQNPSKRVQTLFFLRLDTVWLVSFNIMAITHFDRRVAGSRHLGILSYACHTSSQEDLAP